MKNRYLVLLLTMLMLLAGSAGAEVLFPADLEAIEEQAFAGDTSLTGRVVLPENVLAVGSRAFAASGVHALVIPAGCAVIEGDILADAQAAYVYLTGADTLVMNGVMLDVPFVFGPAEGSASAMSGFYALETLAEADGLYYSLTADAAVPLCPVEYVEGAEITLPKFVGGMPVRSLSTLNLAGCKSHVTLRIPSYLKAPSGVKASAYDAMTVEAPAASTAEASVGEYVTWTTAAANGYGEISYIWTFVTGSNVSSMLTAEPSVTCKVMYEGLCTVTVAAVDALGDRVSAAGGEVLVKPPAPVYRALLVGNTYASSDDPLPGPDTDMAAMQTMLGSMQGTDYAVTARHDLSSSGISGAIESTFAGARDFDVSLFYYSGHGTASGALVGADHTMLSVSTLRTVLDTIPGTKIVIIDACYSGNMIGKAAGSRPSAFTSAVVSAFASKPKDNLAAGDYIVLTSCTGSQYSQSITDDLTGHSFGLFTYGVCYGSGYDAWNQTALGRMPADADSDGAITLSETLTCAQERVAYVRGLMSPADAALIDQSAQSFGSGDHILWIK